MQLSFICADGKKDVVTLDIPVADVSYEEFLSMAMGALGLNNNTTYEVTIDGKTFTKEEVTKAGGTVKGLNLKENDLLILSPKVEIKYLEISDNERTNLIRSFQISKNKRQRREDFEHSREGIALYQELQRIPANRIQHARRHFEDQFPGLFDHYQSRPNHKWAFLIAYRNSVHRREAEKKSLGQVAIQRQMETERLKERQQKNIQEAMMETPEAFVHIEMLYINIKLNGVEGKAFIDTGAAKSLISREYAEQCNLGDLINKDHAMTFSGIGGVQASDGTIWRCDMTVGDHELPVTLHVMPKGKAVHQVLLGLDLLQRHRANIDLQTRTLSFQGGVSTPFLSEAESAKVREEEHKGVDTQHEEAMDTEQGTSRQQQ